MKPILVVKVGTTTLLDSKDMPSRTFDEVATSIMDLSKQYRIILVTSGAIGFGVRQLELAARPTNVRQLQALSMIGQVGLMKRWREAFHGRTIGQVLVTRHDFSEQASATTFKEGVEHLWEYGAIPILNENDAVSFEEISFGDNDRLAAEVAIVLGAERLVLLTDQDGIQADFGLDTQHRLKTVGIDEVGSYIVPTKSEFGSGGASSKVIAASLALEQGVEVYIAHAASVQAIEKALSGQIGTKIIQ